MKCDLIVGKKFTFNTGNYSSVSPLLTITLKDVDLEKLQEVHDKLDEIVDGLYHRQIIADIKTMGTVRNIGFDNYFKELDIEEVNEVVRMNIEEIME